MSPELRIPPPKHAFEFVIQDLGPGLQQQVCAFRCPVVAVGIPVTRYRRVAPVAVGTVIARCPPHGPVLALLTHTVLT